VLLLLTVTGRFVSKIAAKILTTRLQQEISALIDLNQTGFLKGRTIAENFVYAAELLQVCHKRKVPTLVLKLDFAKAFDTVNWQGLLRVMEARGFAPQWNNWVLQLLQTSHTAVLVNGCPGPWINCKRGLRQGDPLSPYLFLLIADVLQVLIKKDSSVKHPLDPRQPCPILQYADDTLLLLRGDLAEVQQLKLLLDQFALATGLHINFHKSTAVPMHMDDEYASQCVAALGCRCEGFPQVYLGLPLSCEKLRLSAFDPYIAKADRYLAGWQASLLNPMGRTVLINSVLDGQLGYVMGALPLPPGVIQQVDRRRRSFLWTGEGDARGASCLVAWDKVRDTKDQGGLGIRDLGIQNTCLLLKLIHKLFTAGQSSWAVWVKERVNLASFDGDLLGHHGGVLKELLPVYQAITTVAIGDGRTTSFWHDVWAGDESLAEKLPALHSHCKTTSRSVRQISDEGLELHLMPRLTPLARTELTEARQIIARLRFSDTDDKRQSPLFGIDGHLQTSMLYKLLKSNQSQPDAKAKFIWSSSMPPRVQFFGWLLISDKIQSRVNLQKRKVLEEATL